MSYKCNWKFNNATAGIIDPGKTLIEADTVHYGVMAAIFQTIGNKHRAMSVSENKFKGKGSSNNEKVDEGTKFKRLYKCQRYLQIH